jgi:hypothetical protein
MEEQQTPARRLLGDFAPKMVLAATYRPDQLTSHLRRALALTQLKTITNDAGSGASR